jgi:hypothetical protein
MTPILSTAPRFLASADLLDRLVLPPDVAARSLGPSGKEQAIGLCPLAQATPDTCLAAL